MEEPRRLGDRYELDEVIGRGGMAEVYSGRDLRLGRVVAVKLLRTDLARDPSFHARFRREAQAAASLNHPTIVAVYDTGETDVGGVQVPFMVMEFVDGTTLRDMLRSGHPFPVERSLEITEGVLDALGYSHRHGIVHRDVKPGNVMLTRTGAVKVMDFGIARALADSAATMTSASAVLGTAQYLSPEQARGETVDARSDVYSAGCLLYELLTTRPPFVGDSPVSVAYQHVRETAAVPSSLNPAVSPSVDAAVLRALAKSPDDRYPSAEAMASDLARARQGLPLAATTAVLAAQGGAPTQVLPAIGDTSTALGTVTAAGDPPRRNRAGWYALLALVLVAALAGALFLGRSILGTKQVSVPDLSNLTVAQAQSTLSGQGLRLGQESSAPSSQPKGTVVSQNPRAGVDVAKDSAVAVVVSTGPQLVTVPNLTQITQAQAVTQLNDAHLVLGTTTPQASQSPAGTVLSSSPAAGTQVPVDSKVNLVVSNGQVPVPNVVGQTEQQASASLANANFQVVVQFASTTNPAQVGVVISQDPPSSTASPTLLQQGKTVTITVGQAASPSPTTSPSTSPSTSTSPSATPTHT